MANGREREAFARRDRDPADAFFCRFRTLGAYNVASLVLRRYFTASDFACPVVGPLDVKIRGRENGTLLDAARYVVKFLSDGEGLSLVISHIQRRQIGAPLIFPAS